MSDLGRNRQRSAGPSGPHRFVEPDDNRLGLALGTTRPSLQMGPALAVTDASLRDARCAMKGCGRAREHVIHDVLE
jgi:hypothetical protein